MNTFEDVFNASPSVTAAAPGRVNLLGEHTDYNGGFVLPTAISQKTTVQLRPNGLALFRLYAVTMNKTVSFTLDTPPKQHFARYVYGCLREVQALGVAIPGLDLHVSSKVPMGVGVSSSAALEVAVLRALRTLLSLPVDDIAIARMAQQAEIRYAGVNCGIMDQMASSLADTGRMLFMDTRTLETAVLPLPPDSEIAVIDSGITRTLAGSKYNERRAECNAAAEQLGVTELRDVTDPALAETLPSPLKERARHVISENNRVLAARQGVDAETFGRLMNESHRSLSEDYAVSVAPLDHLVALLQQQPSVFGARLTGAGFGGACVALCKLGTARQISKIVLNRYQQAGHRGKLIVPSKQDES